MTRVKWATAMQATAILGLCVTAPGVRACDLHNVAGFHVAARGDDSADGSARAPFASLVRAQQAMRATGVRVTYLDSGTLLMATPLRLDASDSGTSWIACRNSHAVLDGGGRLPILVSLHNADHVILQGFGLTNTTGTGTAVMLSDSVSDTLATLAISHVGTGVVLAHSGYADISRCLIRAVALSGIEAKDESNDNRFILNTIENVHGRETSGGGLFLHGASRNLLSRNFIHRTQGMGIGISNWSDDTINTDNSIRGNIVRDTNLSARDSGAIYILGRSKADTRLVVEENLVDGGGGTGAHTVGIYLDDLTSGARVSGNVLRRFRGIAMQIHGGSNNVIEGNVLDLGRSTRTAVLFQSAPADTHPTDTGTGNVVRRNAILSSGWSRYPYEQINGGHPMVCHNAYIASKGTQFLSAPPIQDEDPVYGDARFAGQGAYLPPTQLLARLGLMPVLDPVDQINAEKSDRE